MNNELTEKLYAEFPYLYRGHTKPPEDSSMCWGFECGDGWFMLIHELSQKLTDYLENNPALDLEVIQVKSKFGSFCYYVDGGDEITQNLIDDARETAKRVCELTGKEGRMCVSSTGRSRPGPMVLCDEKAKELGYSPFNEEKF
jgi:hypothetical protein